MQNSISYIYLISTVSLISLIGITACDTSSRNSEYSITGPSQSKPSPIASASIEPPSSEEFNLTLQASTTGSEVDLDANNPNTLEKHTFDATSSNPFDVTGTLQITTGSEIASTDLYKVNPIYRTYEHTPRSPSPMAGPPRSTIRLTALPIQALSPRSNKLF